MEKNIHCTLTDQELVEKAEELLNELINTGGKSFTMQIPARPNKDTDLILAEVTSRFKKLVTHPTPQGAVTELANKWVFETNGHKWSNNDNTAGDNYGSFIAGYNAGIQSPVWVKATEFKHEPGVPYHAKDSRFKGGGIFNVEGAFKWGDGTITFRNDQQDLYILDEAPEQVSGDAWISVEDRLPEEGGRYWCYVEEITCLGTSHFQWNCSFNETENKFSDEDLKGGKVTYWRSLPEPPKK